VSVQEGLRIFTINGAKAARLDDVVGSIEVGKAANFVFPDRDPFTVPTEELGSTKVLKTYVAGELVYSA
jgi:predicted amidohydrolase YtcJ